MAAQAKHNPDPDLRNLIQKALAGEELAFGQVYDLYFQKVYRFIFFRVNHKETAEDLVAETFVRVWKKRDAVETAEAFNGWLYQIARNLIIDYYRSRKVTVDITDLENILEYEDRILDKTNLGFDQRAFLEALRKLSPDQQTVIKLKFLDELENSEISKLLGKPEGTIRVIQHRAIAELTNLLKSDSRK